MNEIAAHLIDDHSVSCTSFQAETTFKKVQNCLSWSEKGVNEHRESVAFSKHSYIVILNNITVNDATVG